MLLFKNKIKLKLKKERSVCLKKKKKKKNIIKELSGFHGCKGSFTKDSVSFTGFAESYLYFKHF